MLCFIQFIHNAVKIGLKSFTVDLLSNLKFLLNKLSCFVCTCLSVSSLAINCGGPELIDSSTQLPFVGDNETLDAASFYMNSEENWGVSTTGIYLNSSDSSNGNDNPYMIKDGSVLGSTQYPSIYTTARLSPSSLRYYGLGLENGQYKVELHFKEIQIPATQSWRSLGLRIFDVYLQV